MPVINAASFAVRPSSLTKSKNFSMCCVFIVYIILFHLSWLLLLHDLFEDVMSQ